MRTRSSAIVLSASLAATLALMGAGSSMRGQASNDWWVTHVLNRLWQTQEQSATDTSCGANAFCVDGLTCPQKPLNCGDAKPIAGTFCKGLSGACFACQNAGSAGGGVPPRREEVPACTPPRCGNGIIDTGESKDPEEGMFYCPEDFADVELLPQCIPSVCPRPPPGKHYEPAFDSNGCPTCGVLVDEDLPIDPPEPVCHAAFAVTAVAITDDGGQIAFINGTGLLTIVDRESGARTSIVLEPNDAPVGNPRLWFSPRGSYLFYVPPRRDYGTTIEPMMIVDVQKGTMRPLHEMLSPLLSNVSWVNMSADEKTLAFNGIQLTGGAHQYHIGVYDMPTGVSSILADGTSFFSGPVISADGSTVAILSASSDYGKRYLTVYDVATKQVIPQGFVEPDGFNSYGFSRVALDISDDGKTIGMVLSTAGSLSTNTPWGGMIPTKDVYLMHLDTNTLTPLGIGGGDFTVLWMEFDPHPDSIAIITSRFSEYLTEALYMNAQPKPYLWRPDQPLLAPLNDAAFDRIAKLVSTQSASVISAVNADGGWTVRPHATNLASVTLTNTLTKATTDFAASPDACGN